uniref:C-type lectin domain-containing protein n=1 Tax=Pundamilia nyererei TaxID=303518 RepID=A0A3B4FE90_9CICH
TTEVFRFTGYLLNSVCPAGWQSFGGSCYWMSWEAALEDCIARGGNLASIHTQEEEEFLALYSKGTTKWIGLRSNPIEGGYSWSDGTPLSHTNWGNGEPNNHEGREDCVEMVSNDICGPQMTKKLLWKFPNFSPVAALQV